MRRLALALVAVAALASPAAAQTGSWTTAGNLPFFPTGLHMLPDGTVFFYGGDIAGTPAGRPATVAMAWDPATGGSSTLAPPGYDLFCVGIAQLADGRLFAAGGHVANFVGLANAATYDRATNRWTAHASMNAGRWYPTVTTLGNGDALVTAGQVDTSVGSNTLPQVFQTATGTWRNLTSARLALDMYPRMFVAPNGRVFMAGPSPTTRFLDPAGAGAWTAVGTRPGGYRDYGSAVMYDAGKVLFVGGGDPPTRTAAVIDLDRPAPAWRTVGALATARRHLNATLLPDGKVLVTGGTSGGGFNNTATPALAAELWDPVTERWTTMASQRVARLYHSVAMLLPDGRVMTAGGNGKPEVEIFSPPYLSAGARPVITGLPEVVGHGQQFTVQTSAAAGIAAVTLIRLPSVTHAFDQNQRLVRLAFARATGALTVTAPANGNLAPPGHYMLFILDAQGVPSVARIVRVGPAAGTPAPTGPTITALSPSSTAANSGAFTLSVTGANFGPGATVRWNGVARTTTFVSSTLVRAAIPATAVAASGTATVTVVAGSVVSNAHTFVIGSGISAGGGGGGATSGALNVAITAPKAGATVSGTSWATAWVGGASGTRNTFTATLGGKAAGTAVSSSAGPVSVPVDTRVVTDGSHTLAIGVTDAAGKTGTGSITIVTRNAAGGDGATSPPPPAGTLTVSLTQPAAGATVRGTVWATAWISGTTGTSNAYTLTVGGRTVATQTTASTGPVSLPWATTATDNGPRTLTVTVRDAAGQTGSSSVAVTVAN